MSPISGQGRARVSVYVVHVADAAIDAADDGKDYPDMDAAFTEAVKAGRDIIGEASLGGGEATVEIRVEDESGVSVARASLCLTLTRLSPT